ncbi:hypothetical protein BDW75DRAFT_228405 [Aspergillus navahoensis]
MASKPSAAYLAEDRGQPALIGIVVVTALSAVVVIVRLYARQVLIRGLGWDYLLSCLRSWATMALCTQILRYRSGRLLDALLLKSPDSLVRMYKWLVTTQIALWDNLITDKMCIGSAVVFISTGIVMGLQAKTARKLALLGILCFGVFTSILRIVSMIISIQHEADWYFSPEYRSTRDKKQLIPAVGSRAKRHWLDSFFKSVTKRPNVFYGSGVYDITVDIGVARSPSQEVLGKSEGRDIMVTETVDVEVGRE